MTRFSIKKIVAWQILIWTYAITILRAIRMPNDFAEAHWLLDYRFGFIKRGLVGSLCNFAGYVVGVQMNPQHIFGMSVALLCALSAAIFYIASRAASQDAFQDILLVPGIVFVSSPFVVIMGHLLGYFDALLYLLAIFSIKLILSDRPFFAAGVSSVAILIHESFLLMAFPLVFFAVIARSTSGEKTIRLRLHLWGLAIPVIFFIVITLVQGLSIDAPLLKQQLFEYLNSTGFVSERSQQMAEWQTTTFIEFFSRQVSNLPWRLFHHASIIAVGPPLVTILLCIHLFFQIRVFSFFSLLIIATIGAPLLLHTVAWDVARIFSYTIGGSFLVFWILCETRRARSNDMNSLILLIALPSFLVNITGSIPLMDGCSERFLLIFRLVFYSPAMLLILALIFRNFIAEWLTEFRKLTTAGKLSMVKTEDDSGPGKKA